MAATAIPFRLSHLLPEGPTIVQATYDQANNRLSVTWSQDMKTDAINAGSDLKLWTGHVLTEQINLSDWQDARTVLIPMGDVGSEVHADNWQYTAGSGLFRNADGDEVASFSNEPYTPI